MYPPLWIGERRAPTGERHETPARNGAQGVLWSRHPPRPHCFQRAMASAPISASTAGAEEERGEQSHRGEQTRLITAARRNSSQRPDEAYTPSFLPTHYHPNDRRASGVGAQDLDGNEKWERVRCFEHVVRGLSTGKVAPAPLPHRKTGRLRPHKCSPVTTCGGCRWYEM